jgi:NADH:ubiquinone oxidoreductase subunit 6 (subunit J)
VQGKKERKVFWGQRLIFLGAVLTLFAVILMIVSLPQGGMNSALWCAVAPFLVVGTPCLVISIIRINNPKHILAKEIC